jgi:Ca2+-dependent lipid-binding protein
MNQKSDPSLICDFIDGGSNPVWNESFLFEIPHGPHEVDIAVYDQEKHGQDDLMGSVT